MKNKCWVSSLNGKIYFQYIVQHILNGNHGQMNDMQLISSILKFVGYFANKNSLYFVCNILRSAFTLSSKSNVGVLDIVPHS